MTEPRNDDRSQARREAATLLGVDIEHLSPADGLRVDMVSALRLVIDHEQATILAGNQADLGKLNVAVQSLIALLPGRELPEPESQREDPRQEMWRIYSEMRARGELNLKPLPPEGDSQRRIAELEAEVAALKGGSVPTLGHDLKLEAAPAPALPNVPINPPTADIVPPNEIGVAYVGTKPGPDDPPPRSPPVIDVPKSPNPPAAPAAPQYDYNKEQGWRDYVLPSGEITPTPMSGGRRWWGPVV
jgi:hypothetical protein